MKVTLCSAIGLPFILVSCTALDSDYQEYKKQKEAEVAGAQSPYGATGADPYGVPGGMAGETGSYAPLPGSYTPPPTPSPDPIAPAPALGTSPSDSFYPDIPSISGPTSPAAPAGPSTPHVVAKGDSLWALARRYNTTEDAIRVANGIRGDNIQAGQTLQIPQN